jgi:hypothetical protein
MRLGSFLLDTCTLVHTLCGEEEGGGGGGYGKLEFVYYLIQCSGFLYLSMCHLGMCKFRSHMPQLT